MPKQIKLTISVEVADHENGSDIQRILDNYYFTGTGVRYLDGEMKKPVSIAKAACKSFLKPK